MKVGANGIHFNCEIDGPENGPWVVFSNSLATNLTLWDDQVNELAQEFRVLRYDQRGHGESAATHGDYTFDLLIADVADLLDRLDVEHAHVVGLSMGGVTGLGFAQLHPDRVDKLVVCDSPGASTPSSAAQWGTRIAIAQEQGMGPLVEATIERWFPAVTVAANPPHLNRVRDMIRKTSVDGFVGCAAALSNFDFGSAVGSMICPTLFMVGSQDGNLPVAMRKLSEQLPGSEFVELEGAGHLSNLDAPAEFTARLRRFLYA